MRKRHVKKWANKHACIDFNTYVMRFIYCGGRDVEGRKRPRKWQLTAFELYSPRLVIEMLRSILWDKENQDEQCEGDN